MILSYFYLFVLCQVGEYFTVVIHHHHHIRFYFRFTCWHALDGFQKIDFQANLSLARSLLTLLSLKSTFITSSHVFFFFLLMFPMISDLSLNQTLLKRLMQWLLIRHCNLLYSRWTTVWYSPCSNLHFLISRFFYLCVFSLP